MQAAWRHEPMGARLLWLEFRSRLYHPFSHHLHRNRAGSLKRADRVIVVVVITAPGMRSNGSVRAIADDGREGAVSDIFLGQGR